MHKVAITGNIGSGKTTVCRVFESLGIEVYYADKEAKKFYREPEVINAVKQLFGGEIFDEQNRLLSNKLAGIVFNNPHKLKQLNAIIHPLVLDDFISWSEKPKGGDYILYESALLFESGFNKHFDKSIFVSAPYVLARERVMHRDHISEAEFDARAANQLPEKEKIINADFVIYNDEKSPLIPRVIDLHNKLCK